mmetsp:Transcript_8463/g.28382  ORF Transcript_8463/g.28382 Transcript_8463/m.28382 type:complete len:206 (+) Transcript_8463:853-1470(+)
MCEGHRVQLVQAVRLLQVLPLHLHRPGLHIPQPECPPDAASQRMDAGRGECDISDPRVVPQRVGSLRQLVALVDRLDPRPRLEPQLQGDPLLRPLEDLRIVVPGGLPVEVARVVLRCVHWQDPPHDVFIYILEKAKFPTLGLKFPEADVEVFGLCKQLPVHLLRIAAGEDDGSSLDNALDRVAVHPVGQEHLRFVQHLNTLGHVR